jgi:hypothetical protein
MDHATWQQLVAKKCREKEEETIKLHLKCVEQALVEAKDRATFFEKPMPEVIADLEKRGFNVLVKKVGGQWLLIWW